MPNYTFVKSDGTMGTVTADNPESAISSAQGIDPHSGVQEVKPPNPTPPPAPTASPPPPTTPAPTPTNTNTQLPWANPPAPTPSQTAIANPTPYAQTEESAYQTVLGRNRDAIDAINRNYDTQVRQRQQQGVKDAATARGISAAGGMANSGEGATLQAGTNTYTEDQVLKINAERATAISNAMSNVQSNATTLANDIYTNDAASAEKAIAYQDKLKTDATAAVQTLANGHIDLKAYKDSNSQQYQELVKQLGGDENMLNAIYAASIPKPNILQTTFSGSAATVLSQDPVTGKVTATTYDLGVKIPENWSMEKIGTNAAIFHGSAWDPKNPDTFQMFAIDPITGLPTTQIGGTPNPSADTLQENTAVKNVVSSLNMAGVNADATTPLTTLVDSNAVPMVVAGLIKNEGSSPKGVLNNPGNIKFVGLPGQKDSGVKATDGGTFASYDSPEAGRGAIADLVAKYAKQGSTLGDFVAKYTGTTSQGNGTTPTTSENNSIIQKAGISLPVFNYLTQGTASMSRMSAGQRNQIMQQATDFLNKHGLDVSTFQSQYKTYNDVLSSNIQRQNKTQVMEKELIGTIDNLKTVVKDKDLGKVNKANVAKVWAGQQVNDALATQYAFHFQQLKNELAGYFAASQGKNSPDVIDNTDAALAIVNGMSTGSLDGLKTSIENSTLKMGQVLGSTVDQSRKDIWELFGVGNQYNPRTSATPPPSNSSSSESSSSSGQTIVYQGKKYTVDKNGNLVAA